MARALHLTGTFSARPDNAFVPVTSQRTALFTPDTMTGCGGADCWGLNVVGQLGTGRFGGQDPPSPIVGLPAAPTAYALDETHTCAIVGTTPTRLFCWGENGVGQVGNGKRTIALQAASVAFPWARLRYTLTSMAVVCPACDVVPPPEALAGERCRRCGAGLVTVVSTEPAIGAVIDHRFELLERLGAGAMGVVYRATQLSIGRAVALKVLSGIESAPVVKRFFREARIASALAHPNTVQIIEFGQEPGGHIYLAMELVPGHTLLAELGKGPLASRRITRIGVQLCDALEAAHRLQIVHRDLKPENVMISADGSDHIKVLDFGIARIVGDASSQVTGAGLTAGTPHYMAPEVLSRAAEPAPSQDVYALGVILAELALGDALWPVDTPMPTLLVEKFDNTAIARVPLRLRALVGSLLDPDPLRRPPPVEIRRALLELDRYATDVAGVPVPAGAGALGSASTGVQVAPTWAGLDLVSLDKRDGTRRDEPPLEAFQAPPPMKAPTLVVPPPPLDLDARFAPVVTPPLALEIDRTPVRASPTRTPAVRAPAPVRTSGGGGWVVLVLALAAAGGGAYWYETTQVPRAPATRPVVTPELAPVEDLAPPPPTRVRPSKVPAPKPERPRPVAPTGPVTIRLVGEPGVAIRIDGDAAGPLPIRLERSASTRPMLIEGPGIVRRIIPDRDQTVDLSAPEP